MRYSGTDSPILSDNQNGKDKVCGILYSKRVWKAIEYNFPNPLFYNNQSSEVIVNGISFSSFNFEALCIYLYAMILNHVFYDHPKCNMKACIFVTIEYFQCLWVIFHILCYLCMRYPA